MRSQNRWTGMAVGVVMGVLFSAAVVLAGSLEPSTGPTQAGSQGNSSSYLPIVLKAGGSSSAGVSRTGQTTSYGTRDDGALQKGVAWPNPRFTDNANGTVTDNLTGLIWLKETNCKDMVGGIDKSLDLGKLSWADALTWSNKLAGGKCGLPDSSAVDDWRLPNVKELLSLIDWAYFDPALSNAAGTAKWTIAGDAFTGVHSAYSFWSSTTNAFNTEFALGVTLVNAFVYADLKTETHYVWPVRGGQ